MTTARSSSVRYIGIAALLWNLLGLAAQLGDAYTLSAAPDTLSEEQMALATALPVWATAGGLVATMAGALGSLGLILRKAWSVTLFSLSLLGLVAQDIGLFTSTSTTGMSPGEVPLILQAVVFLIALLLLYVAYGAKRNGKLS